MKEGKLNQRRHKHNTLKQYTQEEEKHQVQYLEAHDTPTLSPPTPPPSLVFFLSLEYIDDYFST